MKRCTKNQLQANIQFLSESKPCKFPFFDLKNTDDSQAQTVDYLTPEADPLSTSTLGAILKFFTKKTNLNSGKV